MRIAEWKERSSVPGSDGIIELPYHPGNHLLVDFLIQRKIILVEFLLFTANAVLGLKAVFVINLNAPSNKLLLSSHKEGR